MVFAGDILLSDHVLNAYEKSGSLSGVLDPGFQSVIHESDIFMANQEFPFSNRGTAAEDKQFTFRLPPERVRIFRELGLDLVTWQITMRLILVWTPFWIPAIPWIRPGFTMWEPEEIWKRPANR